MAGGHGVGHQLDLPPGRHLDRHRSLGGDLRVGSFSDFISFGGYHELGDRAVLAGREAFIEGLDRILLCAGVLAAIGAILCFVLIRPQDFLAHGRQ